jgi:hypothetical protein
VIADLDTLLAALYVELTERIIPSRGPVRRGPGRPPVVTGAELVCLALAQVLLRYDDERHWLRAAPAPGRAPGPQAAGPERVRRPAAGGGAADGGGTAVARRSHARASGATAADGRHASVMRALGGYREAL